MTLDTTDFSLMETRPIRKAKERVSQRIVNSGRDIYNAYIYTWQSQWWQWPRSRVLIAMIGNGRYGAIWWNASLHIDYHWTTPLCRICMHEKAGDIDKISIDDFFQIPTFARLYWADDRALKHLATFTWVCSHSILFYSRISFLFEPYRPFQKNSNQKLTAKLHKCLARSTFRFLPSHLSSTSLSSHPPQD
jgi:hypothetical protein